jgi:hypothetical protein
MGKGEGDEEQIFHSAFLIFHLKAIAKSPSYRLTNEILFARNPAIRSPMANENCENQKWKISGLPFPFALSPFGILFAALRCQLFAIWIASRSYDYHY